MPATHITLAVLTRNRPEALSRALDAACGGIDQPDEVIVSDDSEAELREKTRQVAARYRLVRYLEGPRRGLGANENHIVAHLAPATEWVVFQGDDARLAPDFVARLRAILLEHGEHAQIPSGIEIRNGVYVRPNRLDFLGFQTVPHADYSPGAPLETIVVQATAFPADALRRVSWLEVSPYGADEVDMAMKMRRLGWTFVFRPELVVQHDQSPIGRVEYEAANEIARLYVRLRSFSVYEWRPGRLLAFLVVAPLHLAAAHLHRGEWRAAANVPAITLLAYGAWLRSLRRVWQHA